MKNWKTTVFGLGGAIGLAVVMANDPSLAFLMPWAKLLAIAGNAGLAFFAQDGGKAQP